MTFDSTENYFPVKRFEIEQKFKLKNLSLVRRRLKRLGAKKKKSFVEHNEFYDYRGLLRRKKSILRLRRKGANGGWLAFKGPRLKAKYTKRVEIEMPVDWERAKAILLLTGFRKVFQYSKFREEFNVSSCLVTLDRLPKFGWFLEIEANARNIHRLVKKLGLENRDREERSYLELLLKRGG